MTNFKYTLYLKMKLPPELILIVCDYMHADLTADYNLVLRPARFWHLVEEEDRMVMYPCRTM